MQSRLGNSLVEIVFKSNYMKSSTALKSIQESTTLKAILPRNDKLCLSTMNGYLIISKQDISVLRADNSYCCISYAGKSILCSVTLKEISSRVHLSNFVKVHRSYIINMYQVTSINAACTQLTMEDGQKIPISRSQKKEFKSVLFSFFD